MPTPKNYVSAEITNLCRNQRRRTEGTVVNYKEGRQ